MKIVGLDLSLTATGVADDQGAREVRSNGLRGVERLERLWRAVIAECSHADLVVIEDYAYRAGDAHAHELGELGGVVRVALHARRIRQVAVPPASLKKYGTGRGNAKKEQMLAEAIRRLGYTGSSHNEADAAWLRAMALDQYGEPLVELPKSHRDALTGVRWPALESVA
jgi:Holliday junction resolvasome RuvABC endonuclease subunit